VQHLHVNINCSIDICTSNEYIYNWRLELWQTIFYKEVKITRRIFHTKTWELQKKVKEVVKQVLYGWCSHFHPLHFPSIFFTTITSFANHVQPLSFIFLYPCKCSFPVLLPWNAISRILYFFKFWCDPKFKNIMYNKDLLKDLLSTHLEKCN